MNDPAELAPGTLIAGKFRVQKLLGAGAMGAVYAVLHELTRHQRALKLLHPSARQVPEIVRRFLNEASAAGRAGDPHLVETFDAGILPSGEPYVVMELLAGETLSARLEREGPLPVAFAAELVAQAAAGADAAHRAGIIHRDLKPDNLFVAERAGRPFVKLLDFGVSKFATSAGMAASETCAGVIYGSPAYMAPEQLVGAVDLDARADVYALGVVLYQSLTGKMPFDAPNLQALSVRVFNGEHTPVEQLRADLPPGFANALRRAMAPLREDRYGSAAELASALEPFCGSPLAATAPLAASEPPALAQARSSPPANASHAAEDLDARAASTPVRSPRRVGTFMALAAFGLALAWLSMRSMREPKLDPTLSALREGASSSAPSRSSPSVTIAANPEIVASLRAGEPSAKPAPSSALAQSPRSRPSASSRPNSGPPPATTPATTPPAPAAADTLGLHRGNPFK